MKIKKQIVVISSVALLLGLVAWSPPSSEDIVVGSTSMTSPNGAIVVVGSGSVGKARGSLIVGADHVVSNSSGQTERFGTIINGTDNTVDASTSIISGYNNQAVRPGAVDVKASGIIGGNNNINNAHGYILGYFNTVSGDYGSAVGYGLNVTQNQALAVGRYNATQASGEIFTVGAGSSTTAFSAFKVNLDGSVALGKAQGDISMGIYN